MKRFTAICDIALALSLAFGTAAGMLEKKAEAHKLPVKRLDVTPLNDNYRVVPVDGKYNPATATGSALAAYSDKASNNATLK